MNGKIIAFVVVMAFLAVPALAVDTAAEDSEGFVIIDGTGKTFEFDGPAERIVATGEGAARTILAAGMGDKIVASDSYGASYLSGQGFEVESFGSIYSASNYENIEASILKYVEDGLLSVDDPIVLTSSPGLTEVQDYLLSKGFKNVMLWVNASASSYDKVIDFVGSLSTIVAGVDNKVIKSMDGDIAKVETVVDSIPESEKRDAIIAWFSTSNGLMIGNSGIANGMLEYCNANDIGANPDYNTYYGDEAQLLKLIEEHPGAAIFISSSYTTAGYTAEDFAKKLKGADYTVVVMGSQWNNWCPESSEGLLEMAQCLYPEQFGIENDGNVDDSDDGDSNIIYWAVALVVVIIIAALAYVTFKRIHK